MVQLLYWISHVPSRRVWWPEDSCQTLCSLLILARNDLFDLLPILLFGRNITWICLYQVLLHKWACGKCAVYLSWICFLLTKIFHSNKAVQDIPNLVLSSFGMPAEYHSNESIHWSYCEFSLYVEGRYYCYEKTNDEDVSRGRPKTVSRRAVERKSIKATATAACVLQTTVSLTHANSYHASVSGHRTSIQWLSKVVRECDAVASREPLVATAPI